ncbi:mitochondrial carrier protein [Ascosphaera apis ARSEF 7405]|uniref:Mitochondrial carrier protein n=1 Tax=Ascosphaera apis ARSEF 7405 TaxID=392613 RepID=A0A167YDR8_9EURO|nr:mitochondrial carrier protein [Ascosphaera apis ARSEF 7405]
MPSWKHSDDDGKNASLTSTLNPSPSLSSRSAYPSTTSPTGFAQSSLGFPSPYMTAMDDATKIRNRWLQSYPLLSASIPATVIATLSATPLENLKTRMQMHKFRSISDAAKFIYTTEGLRGYAAGFAAPLVSVTLVRAINFTVQGHLKSFCADVIEPLTGENALDVYNAPGRLPTVSTVLCSVSSGMISGLASVPIACPFELAKNVVQTSVLMGYRRDGGDVRTLADNGNSRASTTSPNNPSSSSQSLKRSHPRHINTWEAFRQIVARHGFRGLYTGVHLHATRDTIGTGLYFGVYETTKQMMFAYFPGSQASVAAPIVAGALCSVFPWMLTYPLDTKKTRLQSVLLGLSKQAEKGAMQAARSPYMGISVSVIRTTFQNVMLMSFYEYFKKEISKLPV